VVVEVAAPVIIRTVIPSILAGIAKFAGWSPRAQPGAVLAAQIRRGLVRISPISTASAADVISTPNLPATIPQPPPVFYPPTLPAYQPPPPGTVGSGSSGIPPRPPPGATPPISPVGGVPSSFPSMWPYVIGQVAGPSVLDAILRANQYATGFFDVITGKPPKPIPKGPTRRPPRAPPREPSPEIRAPRERIPRSEQVAAILGSLGGDIWVDTRRLPVPRVPRPRPAAPPPPPPVPLWRQLLPILGPSVLGMIAPSRGGTTVRLTDPLSRPGTSTAGLTSPQTLVQSFYSGGTPLNTATCECAKPRKKGPKKRRTVCYSGTYSERADGLRKSKKRKIPCR
jgi:hypothetical protein